MDLLTRVLLIVMVMFLSSCTHNSDNEDIPINFASCKMSCDKQAQACVATCRNSCDRCEAFREVSSSAYYKHYVHEQVVQGGTIARELNSYRDPLQCRKTTCDCLADFNVCLQLCRGVIQKQLRKAPKCE